MIYVFRINFLLCSNPADTRTWDNVNQCCVDVWVYVLFSTLCAWYRFSKGDLSNTSTDSTITNKMLYRDIRDLPL